MWCENLTDKDIMRELGRKVPYILNHNLKNKYVRYRILGNFLSPKDIEYLYFFINDNMQIKEIDPDLGI